jgi:hypothetical protein
MEYIFIIEMLINIMTVIGKQMQKTDKEGYFLKMVNFQGIGIMIKDKVKEDSEYNKKDKF